MAGRVARAISLAAAIGSFALGQAPWLPPTMITERRSVEAIYDAALAEGGIVTCWHGGDELNQQDALKSAFERRFPGMTLNLTINLSKYLNGRLDTQLAAKDVSVDSVILQTLQNYPRWAQQGALLNYAPIGFDAIWPSFKDETAAWYGVYVLSWAGVWNDKKLPGIEQPVEWGDWLRPEFKGKLVLTYPHDDDAVLFAFYLVLRQYGVGWFDALLAQEPLWVRGAMTPRTLISQGEFPRAATFTTGGGWRPSPPIKVSRPTEGLFVSWPQTAAILLDAPHPEGAKLLHNFILSAEWQQSSGAWPVREDVDVPEGFPDIMHMNGTNPTEFARFMADRPLVEKLKLFFEDRLGPPQGLNPVIDGI